MQNNLVDDQKNLCREILEDPASLERYISGERYIKQSLESHVKGERYRYLAVPKLFTTHDEQIFSYITSTMYKILIKVIQRYMDDPSYRKIFGFNKELEELILSYCPYEELLPIARFDIFFDEVTKDYHFCELNTDGSSGMGEDYIIGKVIYSFPQVASYVHTNHAKSFNVYKNVANEVLRVYKTIKNPKPSPYIVIADFAESSTYSEFYAFKKTFEALGCMADVCDVREIQVDAQGYMCLNSKRVDAVYRRSVTGELMNKKEQAMGFIEGIKQGKTAVIGHVRTQIPHTKLIFLALYKEETMCFLTQEEREFITSHVPETRILKKNDEMYDMALINKDGYIIKPFDEYASKGVVAGKDETEESWQALLEEKAEDGYIIQQFITPFVTPNALMKHHQMECFNFFNLTGLYCLGGKFSGIFSRSGEFNIVSDATGGFSLNSLIVEDK